tara:strand:- start:632 stop:919 length:288 start_codon:yes stop_codon:yes gene_type:complete
MGRRKLEVAAQESPFTIQPYFEHNGFVIEAGDLVKVRGEYGAKFKVRGLTTNTETGSTWIDVFELFRGKPQQFRAFKQDRIKRIPQKGKRAKRVV